MSKIKVDEISNTLDNGPVYFPFGVTGDASRMTLKPGIESFAPNQLETNVGLTSSIQIGFNQNMQFLGVGTIHIRSGSATGTIHESFTCGVSAGATITNNLLTINPSTNFVINTSYFVTLPNTGIANSLGATIDEVTNYQFTTIPTNFDAQGGDYVFTVNDSNSPTNYYKYHVFANPGILTTTAPSALSDDMQVMMIAGGGAGGGGKYPSPSNFPSYQPRVSGGGGAGGYLTFTGPTLNIGTGQHTITIGAGGTAANIHSSLATTPYPSRNGSDTIFVSPTITYTVIGGGYGGNWYPGGTPGTLNVPNTQDGHPGGSGGGGGGSPGSTPTWGIKGQSLNGQGSDGYPQTTGDYSPTNSPYPSPGGAAGGGGGGAGSSGGSAQYWTAPGNNPRAYRRHGDGGNGAPNPAFPGTVLGPRVTSPDPTTFTRLGPTNDYWAGGGSGAGAGYNPNGYALSNEGGYGGGGKSAEPWQSGQPTTPYISNPSDPQNGAALTGGGGGGGWQGGSGPDTSSSPTDAGNGGPGVVMLRYAHPGS